MNNTHSSIEGLHLRLVWYPLISSAHFLQKLIALGEHHQQEIQALKEEHAQEMLERDRELNALKEEHERQMWLIELENMVMQH